VHDGIKLQALVVSLRGIISDVSNRIYQQVQSNLSRSKKLEAQMLDWVERQGLGRKEDRVKLVSRQAVYHLLLKLMLYELIKERVSLPAVSVGSLESLQQLFRLAHQQTRMDAFEKTFLDKILDGCDGELSASLTGIAQLVEKVEQNKADFIGRVYEDIIPGEERRKLGEFYTPRDIAQFMSKWAVQDRSDRVLDPACGSGTFLVESFYRLGELGCTPEEATVGIHGIDLNPLAVLMTTVNLVARAPLSSPTVWLSDFLSMAPLELTRKFQAIICNPPYSRHHELPQDYKELIANTAGAESGSRISRLSSIYVHFLIHSTAFLDDGGRMAFITPSEYLDVDYGVELKKFLVERLTLKAVILYPEESLVFPGVLTTACITLLERRKPSPRHNVVFVRLNKLPDYGDLLRVVEAGEETEPSWGKACLAPQSELDPKDKWSYVTSKTHEIQDLIPLRKIARVHRGIATGANDFFTLSEPEISRYGIERDFLRPVITNARIVRYYDFTKRDFHALTRSGKKVWLLFCDRPKAELKKHRALQKYLALGEQRKLHERYLTRTRNVWYFQERKQFAPIVFTYMSRENPRFVYNEAGALTLNTLHTIHPVEAIARDKPRLKALLCFLNSEICRGLLKKTGRVYGGGLLKLEPRELENLPVIALEKLSESDIQQLAELFDELCQSSREGMEQDVRRKINDTVSRIMKG